VLELHATLAGLRPDAADALAETVSALETLRMDLPRLRARAMTDEGITLDVSAVRLLGEEVDATLAAKAEARRLLAERGTPG
jgi:hypothetical protein